MTAANRRPYRATDSDVAGTSTVTQDYTVPTGKVWQVGVLTAEFGTAAAGNTCDIQHDSALTSTYVNLTDQMLNFTKANYDPLSEYPDNIELEAGKTLRFSFVRGTSSTCASKIRVRERDA